MARGYEVVYDEDDNENALKGTSSIIQKNNDQAERINTGVDRQHVTDTKVFGILQEMKNLHLQLTGLPMKVQK